VFLVPVLTLPLPDLLLNYRDFKLPQIEKLGYGGPLDRLAAPSAASLLPRLRLESHTTPTLVEKMECRAIVVVSRQSLGFGRRNISSMGRGQEGNEHFQMIWVPHSCVVLLVEKRTEPLDIGEYISLFICGSLRPFLLFPVVVSLALFV
jgi:hypothetical protein